MALFKCIKTHTKASTIERRQRTAGDGTVSVIEIDRDITITPGAYGHENIQVGGLYEIVGYLADKARANTEYFEEVKDVPAEVVESAVIVDKTETVEKAEEKPAAGQKKK